MASKEQMIDFIIRASTDSGFHGTFSKAQESFTKLSKEIQNLQRVQRDVSSYQKQQAAVEKNGAKLENLQDQYDLLQKEIEETEGSTTALERESLKLDQRIRETTNVLESQKQKLNATGERLQEAKVDTNDLEKADARLTEQLKTLRAEQDRTAQSIENAAGSAEEFGETASSGFAAAGQALAAAGIVAGLKKITGAYRECIQTAAGFGASMSYTGALSNASDAEMAALSTKAKEMGADKKFTAKESADAFGYMSLAGWKARQQVTGIEPVLNLATAANMDLAKASDIVTDYLTAFGLTANDAAAFTDKMAYAMSHSNTDVTQLGEAYKNCAATAKSMNYSVEETTAVLMGMANAGVKGGEAGTALNAVMTRLATDTKGCATALAEYKVNVYDAKGNMNSLSEILSGTSRVWETLTGAEQAALAKTIAGADHYSELQTIMSACSKEAKASGQSFSDYAAALQDCSGTAAQMADRMLDNLSGDLVRMDSALEAVKLTLGEQFTPELRNLTQLGTGALTVLNQAMEKHPAVTKTITSFVSIMTLATGAVTAYGAASKAVNALKLDEKIKDTFLSAAPFLGVTAAVGGLAAVFTGLKDEWEAAVPEAIALNEAVRDLNQTLEETSVHSIENEAQANAAAAEAYLDKIEALGAVQNRTREQELLYQGALAGLSEVAPELSDCISQTADEYGRVTYAVNGSTEAIRANIEVMKQQAVFDEFQDRIKKIASESGTAMVDIELAEIRRAELEEQYKEPLRQREELQKKLDAAAKRSSGMDTTAEIRNLHEELDALGSQYGYIFTQADEFDQQIAQGNETLAEADEELLLYNKAMDGVAEKLGVAKDAAGDTAGAVEGLGGSFTETQEASKAFKEGLTEISEGVKAVAEAYQAAYDSAYSSVSGQYGLLEEVEKAVPTGLGAIQKALADQTGYWDSYGQNLETLQQRAKDIAGLGDYLARVADGSAESANILAGLAGLSDDQLAQIARADQELQAKWDEVSEQLADMRGDWEGELDKWRDQLTETIEEMDQSGEAREAVEETIRGLIDAANDPSLRAEMRNAFAGLAQSARIELGSANGYVSTTLLHDGYASGTRNAERGWKLVGEEGPELMFFHGGESVLNARDTASVQRKQNEISQRLIEMRTRWEGDPYKWGSLPPKAAGEASRQESGGGTGMETIALFRGLDGYASGTRNAERGWKLAGEEGPELMFFRDSGGLNAWENASTPQNLNILFNQPNGVTEKQNVNRQEYGSELQPQIKQSVILDGLAIAGVTDAIRETRTAAMEVSEHTELGSGGVLPARDSASVHNSVARYEAAYEPPPVTAPVSVQIAINVQGNASQDTVDALQERAAEIAGMVTDQVMDRIHEEQTDAVRRSIMT